MINFVLKIFEKRVKNLTEERKEILVFSLYVIMYEIPKILLIFVIAGFLEIFKDVLVGFLMLSTYRSNSGGFHLRTNLGCFLWSSLILLLPAIIFTRVELIIANEYLLIIYILALIFNLFCVNKYAPADNENAPIVSFEIRRKKKIYSYIAVIINFIVSLILIENSISKIITVLIVIQSISITPIMYKISKCKYGKEVE